METSTHGNKLYGLQLKYDPLWVSLELILLISGLTQNVLMNPAQVYDVDQYFTLECDFFKDLISLI